MDEPSREVTPQPVDLYDRIQAFSLDQLDAPLSFSKRLARDNNWSLSYAQRVIEEYKKFTFLAIAAGHPVTPSDQVDQVWHLHLSYTRSYWQEFCPNVLQTPLHHEPTRGGVLEQLKFDDWYCKTLESYKQFFGQSPPTDIWSNPEIRFGRDLHFVRTNTQQNWIVPKPSFSYLGNLQHKQVVVLSLLFTLALVVSGCQIASTIPNPLNFRGPEFLSFYFLLSIIVIFFASLLRNYLRLPDSNPSEQSVSLDAYETAYLAEGKNRVVDTAIASLVQKGYVAVEGARRTLTLNGSAQGIPDQIERVVARAIEIDGRIDRVRDAISVNYQINGIRDQLRQLGLIVSQEQSLKAQAYPAILFGALLGLGIAKIVVGISRQKPVGFLVMMCFIVAVVGLSFWGGSIHRSRYGDRILNDLRKRTRSQQSTLYDNLDSQFSLAFALFGTVVLASGSLAELKQVLAPVMTDGGGGGGSDSGGDGGGCGGGGCGGCGGCGG